MLIMKSLQIIAPVETEAEDHMGTLFAPARDIKGKRKADDDDEDNGPGSSFQTFGASPSKKART